MHKVVEPPKDRRCCNKHTIREGSTYRGKPTRFLQMDGPDLYGVYCEPCVLIHEFMSEFKKTKTA